MKPEAVTLSGAHVRLTPLALSHAQGLFEVGREESIWTFLMREPFRDVDDARQWIEDALAAQRTGTQIPWTIVHQLSERVCGSTRYLNIAPDDRGLEIGWTWLGGEYRRTVVNTECKLLLLRHAFETLGYARVQLKTDALNERSRRAIERIGGVFEGVLRKYQRTRGGRIRDTAMYSILDSEWPAVRDKLEAMLNQ